MTAYSKLTVYLRSGRMIVKRWPTSEIPYRIEEAKKSPDFLEHRVEPA